MINILLNGCTGKMGQTLSTLLNDSNEIKVAAGVSPLDCAECHYPLYKNIADCKESFDIIVDFSIANAADQLIDYACRNNKPLFIATTGHSKLQIAKIHKASKSIPIFYCSNASIGVNLLLELVKIVVPILGNSFDIEIIEKHHAHKIDTPSGTAISIAKIINEVSDTKYNYIYHRENRNHRAKNEIGIHSIRGGTYPGEHTVIFAGEDEILEIKHTALSRKIFAKGALQIIKFLSGKSKGLYIMDHMFKSR